MQFLYHNKLRDANARRVADLKDIYGTETAAYNFANFSELPQIFAIIFLGGIRSE